MRSQLFASVALSALLATGTFADDRLVTDDERVRLVEAIAAQGCSGGRMAFDDGYYEVDDAKCSDGRKYDLKFDTAFKLIEKELED